MEQTRRSLIRTVSALGATAVISSVASATPDSNSEFGDAITSAEIRTTSQDCGDEDWAETSIENGSVAIEGQLAVPIPCHEATFISIRADDGTLYVLIGAELEDGSCIDCHGTIGYEARIEASSPVEDVVVTHNP